MRSNVPGPYGGRSPMDNNDTIGLSTNRAEVPYDDDPDGGFDIDDNDDEQEQKQKQEEEWDLNPQDNDPANLGSPEEFTRGANPEDEDERFGKNDIDLNMEVFSSDGVQVGFVFEADVDRFIIRGESMFYGATYGMISHVAHPLYHDGSIHLSVTSGHLLEVEVTPDGDFVPVQLRRRVVGWQDEFEPEIYRHRGLRCSGWPLGLEHDGSGM